MILTVLYRNVRQALQHLRHRFIITISDQVAHQNDVIITQRAVPADLRPSAV